MWQIFACFEVDFGQNLLKQQIYLYFFTFHQICAARWHGFDFQAVGLGFITH